MFKPTLVLTTLAVAVAALLTAGATQAAWMPITRANHLTFNKAVRLPNAVLVPGTYTFESGPQGTNVDIVRVTTRRGGKVIYLGFTTPVSRSSRGEVVSFGEAAAGAPQPIIEWYEAGATQGHRFRY